MFIIFRPLVGGPHLESHTYCSAGIGTTDRQRCSDLGSNAIKRDQGGVRKYLLRPEHSVRCCLLSFFEIPCVDQGPDREGSDNIYATCRICYMHIGTLKPQRISGSKSDHWTKAQTFDFNCMKSISTPKYTLQEGDHRKRRLYV